MTGKAAATPVCQPDSTLARCATLIATFYQSMHTFAHSSQRTASDGVGDGDGSVGVDLLTEVDFKWLMAGQGWHVDAARFQSDAAYAEKMLQLAIESSCAALSDCAAKIVNKYGHAVQIIQL